MGEQVRCGTYVSPLREPRISYHSPFGFTMAIRTSGPPREERPTASSGTCPSSLLGNPRRRLGAGGRAIVSVKYLFFLEHLHEANLSWCEPKLHTRMVVPIRANYGQGFSCIGLRLMHFHDL